MSRREKVIVVLAVIALLYGGFNFLFKNKKKRLPVTKVNIASITNSVFAIVKKTSITNQEKIIYDIIPDSVNDPFMYLNSKKIRDEEPVVNSNISFEYKGFVISGGKRFAIINGREYGEGDELKEKGFRVWSILKDKVVIKGPGKSNFIVVPFIDNIKTN